MMYVYVLMYALQGISVYDCPTQVCLSPNLLSLDNYYGNAMWVKHDKDMDLMKMFMKVSYDRESSLRFWMSLCMQTCMFTRELESGLSACMKVFHDRMLGPRMFMYVPKLLRIYANMTKCLYKHACMYLCFRKEIIMCLACK